MPPSRRKPTHKRIDPVAERIEEIVAGRADSGDEEAQQIEDALAASDDVTVVVTDPETREVLVQSSEQPGDPVGPGLLEDVGLEPDLGPTGGRPPERASTIDEPPSSPHVPFPVRLTAPDSAETADQNLWTLIRNRTDAISFNNYFRYIDDVICQQPRARGSLSASVRDQVNDLAFLGLDGYEVLRAATEYFLMHEVGLIVEDPDRGLSTEYLQQRYDAAMGIDGNTDPTKTTEYRRRNQHRLPADWLTRLRDDYLDDLGSSAGPRVLPYLDLILSRLRDLPTKTDEEVAAGCYGVLPSRLIGPLALELIWNYWHEEGMLVQAHNAITNRFQNLRSTTREPDPLVRLETDPLRRLNNVLWGWIQSRPFLLSVRRRAYEYDHHYGITLLGKAAGTVDGADSRSQFLSAFHNLLHLCTIFYQQADDLTVQPDGFPLLNALRETQLVITAGAHNQYGDLPWTARVEMLMQAWIFARPEMREFLGGRTMVPYKEPWMDRVDTVKSMMGWTDVNVTHFRDLGTFGEQILLSVRYGSWTDEIDSVAAANWARYWRPEIQGYVHAYRAATGADLRQTVDTTMPGTLLTRTMRRPAPAPAVARTAGTRAVAGRTARALPPSASRGLPAATGVPQAVPQPVRTGHELA